MTVLQAACVVACNLVLAGWCLVRAVHIEAPPVALVYRRLYGERAHRTAPASSAHWERPFSAVGGWLARTALGDRLGESRRFELRVADATVTAVCTRVASAAAVGFVAAVVAVSLPAVAGARWPWWLLVATPFAIAALTGWYQWTVISARLRNRYGEFRAGIAGYVALVSVCLTTRRSASEAVTYAADVGVGRAFESIAAAVHAAPQMGLQAWEALDGVGVEYGSRELEDLATSIANVANVGVGVESTVVAVAARMRQIALDDMQRQADRQTATMFGPTMLFVIGTVAFLAYPLAQRILEAFTTTS